MVKRVKVVRVTHTEFELEDRRVYQHPVELDDVPTVEEFQALYDKWQTILEDTIERETHRDSRDSETFGRGHFHS